MPIQKKCAKNAHFCHPSKTLKISITCACPVFEKCREPIDTGVPRNYIIVHK